MTVTVVEHSASAATAGGIAASYPGDVGIENDANVVFVEKFDETALTSLFSRWTDVLNGAAMSFSADVPPGSPGTHSLNIPGMGGGVEHGGHLYKQLTPGVDDTLYVRYYIKYPTSGAYEHDGIWMGGHNPAVVLAESAGRHQAGRQRSLLGGGRTDRRSTAASITTTTG